MAQHPSPGDDIEALMKELFKAYDLDESGSLTRSEFMKVEMRLAFEAGEVFHEEAESAKMSIADKDKSGTLDFEEFRERQLRSFSEAGMHKSEIIHFLKEQTRRTLSERVKMGPRYHAGIRQALKRIFHLYDVSGDGALSPEEWIAAQKVVALEISDEIDEDWISEGAFQAADENGDGVLQMDEFLEASFCMFEGVKRRSDELLVTLQRVVAVLEQRGKGKVQETNPLAIFVQSGDQIPFQPPHSAWQDEPTQEDETRNAQAWKEVGSVTVPLNLCTVEEVASIIRLKTDMDPATWLSIFYQGPPPDGPGGIRPVTLMRGQRPGEGNVQGALEYLAKPNAPDRLYVKNKRKKPAKLSRIQRAFLEERDTLLASRSNSGVKWGLDWETQLVGEGMLLPPRPLMVALGDSVVVEVPETDDGGEYRYVSNVYMDGTDVLSKPVDENIIPKASKKKKKGPAASSDPLLQLTFVPLKEGKCVFFVEVSWEDQEEKLAAVHGLTAPVAENTVARIGPIEVEVTKTPFEQRGKDKEGAFQWWNGEKWSAKKGPAKKKGKKK
eukprot:TRINITY_DN28234_c0_g2_i1.p1 TRINITY_DN28234_c0_g2~~TRINITY_DN28234_c0_g2_i1.p1  ORF type:complete len:554 (+),score=149.31 TRINITY_DN28234_c0_g2_i1:185-1846(+)